MQIESAEEFNKQTYFQVWVTYSKCEETKSMNPEELAMESEPIASMHDAIAESLEVVEQIREDYENSESVSDPREDRYGVYIVSEKGNMIASVTVVSFDYSHETIH